MFGEGHAPLWQYFIIKGPGNAAFLL